MRNKNLKSIFLILSIAIIITSLSIQAVAGDILNGYSGVNTYTSETNPSCNAGDWYGAGITQKVRNYLNPVYTRGTTAVTSFQYYNQDADERDIKNLANNVNFFMFGGHGANRPTENAAHYYSQGSNGIQYHSSTDDINKLDAVAARSTEVKFGSYGKLRWITMYCCNWLTNSGSSTKQTNIFKTMNGARLTMGFASLVYVSNLNWINGYPENATYASWLGDTNRYAIADCFTTAALHYQPRISGTGVVIARVMGHNSARYDLYENSERYSLSSYFPSVAPYTSSPNDYSVLLSCPVQ